MNYQTQRNTVINKYVSLTSRHLNWIKLDGNSNKKHRKKVCDICIELKEKNLDFLTRPIIEIWNEPHLIVQLIPDILYFQSDPFRPVIIEVFNTESEEHVKSKQYPNDFKVIPVGIDESLEGLI